MLLIPPGLAISFQRFQCPESGRLARAPESLGALPIGYSAESGLLLPLATNECFWIGLGAEQAPTRIELAVAVTLRNALVLDALSGDVWQPHAPTTCRVPGTPRIEGIRREQGFRIFGRDPSRPDDAAVRLHIRVRALDELRERDLARRAGAQWEREVAVELVDYAHFCSECAAPAPAPLDPDAGYKGWRLP